MKVFISWSGDLSKLVATELKEFLSTAIQTIDFYLSSEDIESGQRWSNELANELGNSDFGIVCLTRENINSAWINFEAGALSKALDSSRLCPFLIGIEQTDITGPLTQFQSIKLTNDSVKKLLVDLNTANSERRLNENVITRAFDAHWPESYEKIQVALTSSVGVNKPAKRGVHDMVEEILSIVRETPKQKKSNLFRFEDVISTTKEGKILLSKIQSLISFSEELDELLRGLEYPATEEFRKLISKKNRMDLVVAQIDRITSHSIHMF
jgi:hypothetical protein